MHRWTARCLLLIALVGDFLPAALALSAEPPPHACCVRKASSHPCHGMAGESQRDALRTAGCCRQDCCHAVAVARWAQLAPGTYAESVRDGGANIAFWQSDSAITNLSELHSSRAPPQFS